MAVWHQWLTVLELRWSCVLSFVSTFVRAHIHSECPMDVPGILSGVQLSLRSPGGKALLDSVRSWSRGLSTRIVKDESFALGLGESWDTGGREDS